MKSLIQLTIISLISVSSLYAQLIPINLSNWTQEGLLTNGTWNVSGDGSYVDQSINGNPTFFISPDTLINTTLRGTLSVRTTSDDDFIGFVFGYQSPVGEDDYFSFILLDWKQLRQNVNGRWAEEGLTLSRVEGTVSGLTSSPYWNHTDSTMHVLDSLYGSDHGWADNTEYLVEISYESSRIVVMIDSTVIFDVDGEFQAGRFGFYNYSQPNVRYRGFSYNQLPVAQNDYAITAFQKPVNISVLANDYDPDGSEIFIDHINPPQNGMAIQFADSIAIYTPDSSFSGIDSFSYVIVDSLGFSDSAIVFVTVNQFPVALNDTVSTEFRVPIDIAILQNDYDPDNREIIIDHIYQPSNGTVLMLNDTVVTYNPDSTFFGLDSFSYVISDPLGFMDTAIVFITVHELQTGISETNIIASNFYLEQNFPNPFNPSTQFRYYLPKAGKVRIDIFNNLGQGIKILYNDYTQAGQHLIDFNAGHLPSGVYYYRIQSAEFHDVKKMLLLK